MVQKPRIEIELENCNTFSLESDYIQFLKKKVTKKAIA